MDTTFEVGREYIYKDPPTLLSPTTKYKCLCIDTENNVAILKYIRLNNGKPPKYYEIDLSLVKNYKLLPIKQVATPKYVAVIESDGNPVISPLVWSNKKDLKNHAKMVHYKVIDIIEIKWEREV